jgi:hypothetical protein
MIPKGIENIFEEYAEDEHNLYVTSVNYSDSNFSVDFVLNVQNINNKGSIIQTWRLEAIKHRKNHICFDSASSIEIKNDHPLLW